jgi:hypothetical protein
MNIPNLPTAKMSNENGFPTDVELQFRQNLIQALQNGAGEEGLTIPEQPSSNPDNIAIIVANKDVQGNYTCTPRFLYDSTNDLIKAVVYVGGVPTLKTVTLT